MKKSLTLALALVTLALMGTEVMAQIRTINLNTGYDQWSNTKIGLGQQDNEWRVMQSTPNNPPSAPPATGRPADVVNDIVWVNQNTNLPTYFPNSRWISFAPNAGLGSTIVASYKYSFYFTLPPGVSSPQLQMKLSADDHITEVKLNACQLFTGSGGIFINPPLPISSSLPTCFNPGPSVNELTVTVGNTVAMSITGLIVDGTVTYKDCDRLPILKIPGLTSITFWESTFAAPTQHIFPKGGPELTTKLIGLNSSNKDFQGAPGEFYDVFYSTWDGTFSPTGQFVTIEAVWNAGAPSGGALNIARVDFNGTGQFADSVASFVALGNNAMPNDVGKAVDGATSTDTTMGNTIGQTQRLRVTVGFPCRGFETKPDLTIKKRVSCSGPVTSQGQKCTITFAITNNGPGTFNGILTVQDSMTPSPAVAWAGGSTPTSTPQGWGWSCGLPLPLGCATTGPVTLAPPGNTTFSVDVYIPTGQYKNCASVKGYTQFPYSSSTLIQEVNSTNNEDCIGFVSSVAACDREIKKTVTPNPVQSGQQVTTTLTVTNVGTAPCPVVGGIIVSDPQPSGLTFQPPVSANKPGWSCGFTGPGVSAFCTSTNPLLPGAANAVTITFAAKVTAPTGSTIENCAEVTNVGDANQANNKSCVTVKVNKKKIGPLADRN